MAWREVSIVSEREEFVSLASREQANVSALCRRFGISRKTGYKWLSRSLLGGPLEDRTRRPHRSPERSDAGVERRVLEVREVHPAWGGRKIAGWLRERGAARVPAPSTITAILQRHGKIDPAESKKREPFTRFEHAAPNDLWQMDFKGHVPMGGGRCHPLTVLDDHSRFAVGLRACSNEREETVRGHLVELFRRYGLPRRVLCDNGPPWGGDERTRHTRLTVWLLKLDIRTTHGRAYHPQTQGKDERFHRTLKAELLSQTDLTDLAGAQRAFDRWREVYNLERPHEALGLRPPSSRYAVSERAYPEAPPPIEYAPGEAVRRVQQGGIIGYRGVEVHVGKAFEGERVAVRPTTREGIITVCLGRHEIGELDLKALPREAPRPRLRASLATLTLPAGVGGAV